MLSNSVKMLSGISLLMVMLPLSGCAQGLASLRGALSPESPPVTLVCPKPLPDPPRSIIDALDAAQKNDPLAEAWTVALVRHLEAQDECAGASAARP